jgi:hypothetical protein
MSIVNKRAAGPSNVAEAQNQSGASLQPPAMSAEERYRRIAEAAYFRAAAREFIGGDPVQDWIEAEREVNAAVAHNMPDAI